MKCPKCGSDLDTGFNCMKCDYRYRHTEKPLTTAEKLLWLVENKRKYPYAYIDKKGKDIFVFIGTDKEVHEKVIPKQGTARYFFDKGEFGEVEYMFNNEEGRPHNLKQYSMKIYGRRKEKNTLQKAKANT